MIKYEDNVSARINGNNLQPLQGASVTVTRLDNGLSAPLYSDNGVTPLAQPLTTDNNGYFGFYAADGKYVLTFSSSRFATFTRQIVLEDPLDNPYATKADLAAGTGAALVSHNGETVASELEALQLADYPALRAYAGLRKNVYVTGAGIAGMFVRDDADTAVLATPVNAAFSVSSGTLAAGTYYYRVSATDGYGETLASTETSIAVPAQLAAPVNAAFTTATTGGTLAAGTYYYRVSAINAVGETLASTETSIVAANLAAPAANAPTTATTGGTLAAATYYYKVTALGAQGETLGSNEVSMATTGTTSTVTITWGAVTGATGYRVYRGTAAGGENVYYAPGNVTTYTDTGAASTAGSPPASNTATTNTNTATVNWSAVTGATGYKVYGRTTGAELLMATLGAVTTWTDTGSVTPAGALPASNTTSGGVTVNWSAVTNATGYKVYGRTTGAELLMATLGNVTTWADNGSVTPAGALPTGYKKDNGNTVIEATNGKRWKKVSVSRSELAADGGSALVGYSGRTVADKLGDLFGFMDSFIAGEADATGLIQRALTRLGSAGGGTVTAPPGKKWNISSTIDFSVLGNAHRSCVIDLNGAEITWTGSMSYVGAMFKLANNKSVTIKGFTLYGNVSAAINSNLNGINIDSLQPDGADLNCLTDFRVRFCNDAVVFGSVATDQNRVSDCQINKFLLESCNRGFVSKSTNVDSLSIRNGQLSSCGTGIDLERAGFIEIDTVIGYACPFTIKVSGPIGPLTIINSQSEQGGLSGNKFLYRKNYTDARNGPITLIGCNVDEKIHMDYDPALGSDAQVLNIVGGYFRDLEAACPDTVVNLFGAHQTAGYTVTLSGANTRMYNFGSRIDGTVNDAGSAQRSPLYGDINGNFAIGAPLGTYSAAGRSVLFMNGSTSSFLGLGAAGTSSGYLAAAAGVMELGGDNGATINITASGSVRASFGTYGMAIKPIASATPASNGDMVFQLTSNTSLQVKVKGSDGVIRTSTLTLA